MGPAIRRDRNAIDEFHHEVGIAGGGSACVQDGCDVRVIQLGKNAALVLKAAEEKIVDVIVSEDLDGHALFKTSIGSPGFENYAHAPSAQFLLDAISA